MPESDYKVNDPKGWGGDPKRGAALGRPTIRKAPKSYDGKIRISEVRLHGDYDSNGTYFGFVAGMPVFWYRNEDLTIDAVLRASSRDIARREVLKFYPNAKVRR